MSELWEMKIKLHANPIPWESNPVAATFINRDVAEQVASLVSMQEQVKEVRINAAGDFQGYYFWENGKETKDKPDAEWKFVDQERTIIYSEIESPTGEMTVGIKAFLDEGSIWISLPGFEHANGLLAEPICVRFLGHNTVSVRIWKQSEGWTNMNTEILFRR